MTEEERKHSFQGKSLGARAAIVAAGPIANFLLAIVIFTAIFTFFGERSTAAKVDIVNPGSAAERAGFKPGDLVVKIDGTTIENFGQMQRIVGMSPNQELHFSVEREGKPVELTAAPELKEITDNFGNTMRIGLLGIQRSASPDDWTLKRHDPLTAFVMAVKECYFVISRSLGYLYDVITGREAADQLGGPIRIAQVSGQVATAGFFALLNLAAIISVSIGLINLFPILCSMVVICCSMESRRSAANLERKHTGNWFPHWPCLRTYANDLRDLERLDSLEVFVSCRAVSTTTQTRGFLTPPVGVRTKIGHKTGHFRSWALRPRGIGVEGTTPVMVRRSWLARGLCAVLLAGGAVVLSIGMSASLGELAAHAQSAGNVGAIRVEGNKRVEPETVKTYLTFNVGDPYDLARVDESLKALFATGLFQDVRIRREGGTVVIVVVENPIVSRVAFEGNSEVEDDALTAEVQLKPRTVYTRARSSGRTAHSRRLPPPGPLRGASRSENHQA